MKASLLILTLLLTFGIARAEDTTPSSPTSPQTLEQRQQRLQEQITRGLENGNLTQGEADRLKAELERIKTLEAKLRADGTLTGTERAKLEHRLNELKRDIQHDKRDAKRDAKREKHQGEHPEGEHQGRGEHQGERGGHGGGDKGGKGSRR